jgi:triphosphoribosyl-dephospho-CoA synthase
MALLARFPDSHIGRKFGAEVAARVRARAAGLSPLFTPVARPDTCPALLTFDSELKAQGLNPGTTADFVVATLFAAALGKKLAAPTSS